MTERLNWTEISAAIGDFGTVDANLSPSPFSIRLYAVCYCRTFIAFISLPQTNLGDKPAIWCHFIVQETRSQRNQWLCLIWKGTVLWFHAYLQRWATDCIFLLLKGRATHRSWASVSAEAGQLAVSDNLGALVPALLEHWCILFSHVLCAQSCLTLCGTMEGSSPRSSVHGILQVRILGWVVISFSRGSAWPRDRTWVSCVSFISRWILYH